MKKVLLFSALALSFMMISCTSPLVGTWVQPSTSYTQEQGFVLYKDGTASDINIDFVTFTSWAADLWTKVRQLKAIGAEGILVMDVDKIIL